VYAPVGCRNPVYNSAANGVGLEVGHDTSRMTLLTDINVKTYQFKSHCKDDVMISLH